MDQQVIEFKQKKPNTPLPGLDQGAEPSKKRKNDIVLYNLLFKHKSWELNV